ncbi:MAG: hypothetical protein GY711_07180 [bacterium]|nr:hypothetical protein [bacterium]
MKKCSNWPSEAPFGPDRRYPALIQIVAYLVAALAESLKGERNRQVLDEYNRLRVLCIAVLAKYAALLNVHQGEGVPAPSATDSRRVQLQLMSLLAKHMASVYPAIRGSYRRLRVLDERAETGTLYPDWEHLGTLAMTYFYPQHHRRPGRVRTSSPDLGYVATSALGNLATQEGALSKSILADVDNMEVE